MKKHYSIYLFNVFEVEINARSIFSPKICISEQTNIFIFYYD